MFHLTGMYTDHYQLSMAQVYFLKGHQEHSAVFDYFFRELPFNGGYAIFAGLDDLLDALEALSFTAEDLVFLREHGLNPLFLEYLKSFRFKGRVYASKEGDLVFPTRPVVSIEANIIEAQIIETLLLNILNFQTLIATKARRIQYVAKNRKLIDFGLRRAQGLGGYWASRAAIIGGFDATSNVLAARDYSIPLSGTMAHSFIQSYDSELEAFRDFAEIAPDNCVLLVDTYNTLESGLPNAILVAKEMEKKGARLKGIRLDSGDLAWLAKKARHRLDEAGLDYVQIIASNQLDEFVIQNVLEQEAPIDAFGVGTKLVIGAPDSALDGVYKLAFFNEKPRIKRSETLNKITLPCKKQVYRILDKEGNFWGMDAITHHTEKEIDLVHHPFEINKSLKMQGFQKEALLHKVMENGQRLTPKKTLTDISAFSQQRFERLPLEYKRFINAHIYKVGISLALKRQRDELLLKCCL